MRIFISTNLTLAIEPPEVTIEHKGNAVAFSVSVFGRKVFQEEYDAFEELNGYWAELDDDVQDKVYQCYSNIHNMLSNIVFQDNLTEDMATEIATLYRYHNFDDLRNYVGFKSNIRIPNNIPVDYVKNVDINTTRNKTYIKNDYAQLMTLSLMLRPMLPIWGEHIANTRRDSGTHFKEFNAFKLLRYTNIAELEPMTKLHAYIESILGNKFRPDSILMGISSEDYTNWLLCNLCVRKLSLCDLRGIDDEYNAISYLHRYINQKSENRDNNYENLYKEKKFDDSMSDGTSKISILETYKIKANISPGEIVELEHSISDLHNVAKRLVYTVDPVSLDQTLNAVEVINTSIMGEVKLQLLAYVFKDIISTKAMFYFNKITIAKMMCVAEEVLWEKGHKYLALLVSAYEHKENSDLTINPVDTRSKIDKDLLEKVVKFYPYTKTTNPKGKTKKTSVNMAVVAIDLLTDELSRYKWVITARQERVAEVFGSNTTRCPIVPDIKNHLARLIVEI